MGLSSFLANAHRGALPTLPAAPLPIVGTPMQKRWQRTGLSRKTAAYASFAAFLPGSTMAASEVISKSKG